MLFPKYVYNFMFEALSLAERALNEGEIPIGAVVVHNNKIIGKGYNQTETLKDPTAHAEMIAITAAANSLKEKFLSGCELYITVEPCLMCSGAILLSRIETIYFGANEPKFGSAGSLYNVLGDGKYNHKPKVYSGIYAEESAALLEQYFKSKRIVNNLN